MFKLDQGVSWVSYKYYWSIYRDTSQSVVMLTTQPWAVLLVHLSWHQPVSCNANQTTQRAKEGAHYYQF